MLARMRWPRPIRYLRRTPRSKKRETRPANLVKKITCPGRLHVHFKELLLEVLIRGREGLEQHATRPADQRLPTGKLGRVRRIEMKKTGGKRAQPKHPANNAKRLHRRPRVGMKLSRSHVQLLQNPGRKGIKGERHMQVRKKTTIHEEKGRLGR